MIEQFAIALTALGFLVFTAINRTFVGVVIALVGVPFWLYAAYPDQWGICVAVFVNTAVYLAVIALRIRRLRMQRQIDDDIDEHLSDAM